MEGNNLHKHYEEQLLGRIIFNKDTYYQNSDVIDDRLFHHHQDVFSAFAEAIAEGKHPGVARLLSSVPDKKVTIQKAVKNIDHNIPVGELLTELQEASKIRHIDKQLLVASAAKTSDEKIMALSKAVTEAHKNEKGQFESGYDVAKAAIAEIESNVTTGIPSGFEGLDNLTGGLQPTDLVILAAQSSVGKTALSLNISQNVVDQKKGVCFISLEMSNSQIMTRMISSKAGIPTTYLRENLEAVMNVASQYKELPLYIADVTDNRITHILGLIRGAVLRHGIEVAVVDYLQLIQGVDSRQSREQEIGQIARSLKNLAKEMGITIIALSQLNRPKPGMSPVPTMSRLRDSGQIEEAADIIWFIYRPEYHGITEDEQGNSTEGKAIMIIAKGRNYGTTTFVTDFKSSITTFFNEGVGGGHGELKPSSRFEEQRSLPF